MYVAYNALQKAHSMFKNNKMKNNRSLYYYSWYKSYPKNGLREWILRRPMASLRRPISVAYVVSHSLFYYLNNVKWCILFQFIMKNMPSEGKIHPPPR